MIEHLFRHGVHHIDDIRAYESCSCHHVTMLGCWNQTPLDTPYFDQICCITIPSSVFGAVMTVRGWVGFKNSATTSLSHQHYRQLAMK